MPREFEIERQVARLDDHRMLGQYAGHSTRVTRMLAKIGCPASANTSTSLPV